MKKLFFIPALALVMGVSWSLFGSTEANARDYSKHRVSTYSSHYVHVPPGHRIKKNVPPPHARAHKRGHYRHKSYNRHNHRHYHRHYHSHNRHKTTYRHSGYRYNKPSNTFSLNIIIPGFIY